MEIVNFTPLPSLLGGLLIGIAATLLMWLNGRIAGISGILGGLLPPSSDALWRLAFVLGLVCGGFVYARIGGDLSKIEVAANPTQLIVAGLLVGYGTRLGSGCTSGHGVCGIGRLAPRGIVATLIYMAVAAATVYATDHWFGS